MKKLIALLLIISSLVILASCSNLPKGEAEEIKIMQTNYSWTLKDVDYEYIDESIVKITTAEEDVYYVPTTSIIYIKEK